MIEYPIIMQIVIIMFLFFFVGIVLGEKVKEWRHSKWKDIKWQKRALEGSRE